MPNLLTGSSRYFILVAVVLLFECCTVNNSKKKATERPLLVNEGDKIFVPEDSPLRKRLVIAPVKEVESPHFITFPAVVEADPAMTVNILPPLTGRLTELKVNLGDYVKQGQQLAIIHSPDLEQAYSDVEKARDALDLASKALDRAMKVQDIGGNAVKDLEQIKSAYIQAMSESKRAQNRLHTILDSTTQISEHILSLNAPQAGTVTALNVGVGTYINDATASLLTISNLDNVFITANVPEDKIVYITKGQSADVDFYAYSGQTFHGKIDLISAVLEPDTHRNKIRIIFENLGGKFKPNMFASVKVAIPQVQQIMVPLSALLMNNDSTTVFVEVVPWTFERHVVVLGQEDNDYVRIVSGLKNGERIVIQGGVLLND
jgi:cobalt-zinc-cadmium efflux system membrane fusion protein